MTTMTFLVFVGFMDRHVYLSEYVLFPQRSIITKTKLP